MSDEELLIQDQFNKVVIRPNAEEGSRVTQTVTNSEMKLSEVYVDINGLYELQISRKSKLRRAFDSVTRSPRYTCKYRHRTNNGDWQKCRNTPDFLLKDVQKLATVIDSKTVAFIGRHDNGDGPTPVTLNLETSVWKEMPVISPLVAFKERFSIHSFLVRPDGVLQVEGVVENNGIRRFVFEEERWKEIVFPVVKDLSYNMYSVGFVTTSMLTSLGNSLTDEEKNEQGFRAVQMALAMQRTLASLIF